MKLKHKFRVHQMMDSYPTPEDALFDIVNYLQDRNINLDGEWSDLGIKGAFHVQLSDEDRKSLLQELTDQNFLEMRKGSGKRDYFKIINNPF
jgi:hypothetical protein